MSIKIGEYELVSSGQVIQIDDNPISITLPDEIEGDFSFLINFKKNTEDPQVITRLTQIGKFLLQIDLINFEGQINAGSTQPINVGTLRNIPLYLNYRVLDLLNTGKTFIYNFYTKKEVTNVN